MDTEDHLKEIYYDANNPGSLGGVERLFEQGKKVIPTLTLGQVKVFLSKQNAYTLHKPYRRKFRRNKTIVGSIDKQWQIDLCDMTDLARVNSGHRYILTVIDCFSRFAWAIPVKTKSGPDVAGAVRKLFRQAHPRVPLRIQSDKGTEFFNKDVKRVLDSKNIELFATESEYKAALVERFNRTLKTRIWRYFTAKTTDRYLAVLPKIMNSYNNSIHRSIGQSPASVQKKDEHKIWMRQFGKHKPKNPKKLPVPGDTVRISKAKSIFDKGYVSNWTDEIFNIESEIDRKKGRRVYKVKDDEGEEVFGTFYPEEVQKITTSPDDIFRIETVLRKRKVKGVAQVFVKWKGYSSSHNTWIPATDVISHGGNK